MIATRPYIIYTLPKSRTTQAIPGRKIEKSFDKVKSFLTNCTTALSEQPDSIDLSAYSAYDKDEDAELANQIIKNTKELFGNGETSPIGYMMETGEPHAQTKVEWALKRQDLQKSLNYLISGEPWPRFNLGPVQLLILYNFKLIDPSTKVELPNQQFTSSILVWLSKTCCCNLTLCFPFENPDQSFWDYANKIAAYMPCKFEKKYLRTGRANKKGTANVFSKFELLL